MSKQRWSFKLSDVKRAVQVAKDMELEVSGFRILPDGSICVETSATPPGSPSVEPTKDATTGEWKVA